MTYFDHDIGCWMPDSPEDFMSYEEYMWLEFMDSNPGEWVDPQEECDCPICKCAELHPWEGI